MAYSQPGIFNVLDYNIFPGDLGTATANSAALQQLVFYVQSLGGGTILFPSQYEYEGVNYVSYKFNGPIGIGPPTSPSPVSIIITGTGQGTESQTTFIVENDSDLFQVDTGSPEQDEPPPGGEHIGGITFQNLSIKYAGGTSGTAINVITGENVRILQVVFTDCPQAVWFADTLQCSMFECTAVYNNITANPACVTLGPDESGVIAKEIYIASCTFLSNKLAGTGLVLQGTEHVRVMNVRIEAFSEGINITPGASISGGQNALKHHFGNVTVFTGSESGSTGPAVTIQPQGSESVSEIVFAECTFEPGASATSAGPGVYIDEGAYGGTVSDIRFVSCHMTRWTGPGLQINSGSNIEILGGLYAANASGASPEGGPGGISITGPASAIRIVGAACIGTYPYIQNYDGVMPVATQDVGIYIAGSGASNVIIDHCDLTGNEENGVLIGAGGLNVTNLCIRNCNASGYSSHSAAIDVVGEVSNVQVTDCAGYNDQAAPISTTAPAAGTFSAVTYGYYGPATFYGAGSASLTVTTAGHATGLSNASFTLAPGQTATSTIGTGGHNWTTFLMVGQ